MKLKKLAAEPGSSGRSRELGRLLEASRSAKALIAPIVTAVLPMLALVLALALAGVGTANATPQQAPNSRVVLDLPAGYQPSALFSGFQNDELGVSYVILEVPAKAYEELAAGFASAELAKRGLTDAAKGTLPRSDDYIYMRARQKSPAGTYAKFFVLLRTHDQTVLISTNVPAAAINSGTVSVDDVERVLATARTVDVTAVKTLYRLGYLGPFREAGSFIGTSRLYTLDGRMEPDPQNTTRPTLLVAPSLDKRPVDDDEALARRLVLSLSGYKDLQPGPVRRLSIAGMPAVEVATDAVDATTGAPVRIYQTLICPNDGGYFRVLGFASSSDAANLEPEFRKIAEAFQLSNP